MKRLLLSLLLSLAILGCTNAEYHYISNTGLQLATEKCAANSGVYGVWYVARYTNNTTEIGARCVNGATFRISFKE